MNTTSESSFGIYEVIYTHEGRFSYVFLANNLALPEKIENTDIEMIKISEISEQDVDTFLAIHNKFRSCVSVYGPDYIKIASEEECKNYAKDLRIIETPKSTYQN